MVRVVGMTRSPATELVFHMSADFCVISLPTGGTLTPFLLFLTVLGSGFPPPSLLHVNLGFLSDL